MEAFIAANFHDLLVTLLALKNIVTYNNNL